MLGLFFPKGARGSDKKGVKRCHVWEIAVWGRRRLEQVILKAEAKEWASQRRGLRR